MSEGDGQKRDKPVGKRPGDPNVKMSRGMMSWLLFVVLAIMLVVLLNHGMEAREKISLSQFYTYIENGEVQSLTIRDRSIRGELRPAQGAPPNATRRFEVPVPPKLVDYEFIAWLRASSLQAQQIGQSHRVTHSDLWPAILGVAVCVVGIVLGFVVFW